MQRSTLWMLLFAFAIPLCVAEGNNPTTAKKIKGLVFSKPLFSSNLMDSKELLENDDIIETEFNDCPDPKTEVTPTEGQSFECTQNGATTAAREQSAQNPVEAMTDPDVRRIAAKVSHTRRSPENKIKYAQAKRSTSKTEELSLVHNAIVSSTQEDITAVTTISQIETSAVSSTQEKTNAATTTHQKETYTVSLTQEGTTATTATSQVETSTISSTQEGTTAATTISQVLNITVSSTQEDNTAASTTSQAETSTMSSTQEDANSVVTITFQEEITIESSIQEGHNCTWWKEVGHAEYMISKDKMAFEESRNFCQDFGADIAVLNTTNVQKAIQDITNEIGKKGQLWIGLVRDQTDKNLLKWLNDQNFSTADSSWINGQPNNHKNEQHCVASFRSEDWRLNDKKCTENYYALCQRQKPDQADCNGFANWTFWNNSWYKFFPTEMAWDCAKSVCACNASHLVFIETDEENDFITGTLVTDWSEHIWIGLKLEGDIWKWYNETADIQEDGKGELHSSENRNNEKNCVRLKRNGNRKWKWEKCTSEYFFICEAEKSD